MLTLDQIMAPIDESPIVYDESVAFAETDGQPFAKLLFDVEEILSVTSANKLETYEEGRDWIFCDGKLSLPEGSRIFCFKQDFLYRKEKSPCYSFRTLDGRYSLYNEEHFFHDRQVSVTYRKKAGQTLSFRQPFCGKNLPKTMERLQKNFLDVVLFGDSISEGANSSGKYGAPPYLPTFFDLLTATLNHHYGCRIYGHNLSRGLKGLDWALENAVSHVGNYKPHLAIIAFGMNDRIPKEAFAEQIKRLMGLVRSVSPKTEFLLCATTVPNPELELFTAHQASYKEALDTLVTQGVAVANFRDMQACLLEKKKFLDLTGNNVNHPNDFMVRMHAQVLRDALIDHNEITAH